MRKHVSGSRGGSFLTVLVVILLPLCLLRDLSKLAFSSFFGLACAAESSGGSRPGADVGGTKPAPPWGGAKSRLQGIGGEKGYE